MSFKKINIAGFNLKLSDNFPAGGEFAGDSGDIIADASRGEPFTKLASSKFANVFKFNLLFKSRVHSLILKQYLARKWSDVLMSGIGCGRAKRAFKAGLMLQKNGFLTPPIAAAGKKGSKDFIITAEIKNSVPLYKILESKDPQRRSVIEQFAQTVGQMHAKNIFHGDLRLGNVLVKSTDSKFDFYFLDNERTKKFRKLPHKLRLKNLVQINMLRTGISDADRMRFFKEYLKQQNVKLDETELALQIIARTDERINGQ